MEGGVEERTRVDIVKMWTESLGRSINLLYILPLVQDMAATGCEFRVDRKIFSRALFR